MFDTAPMGLGAGVRSGRWRQEMVSSASDTLSFVVVHVLCTCFFWEGGSVSGLNLGPRSWVFMVGRLWSLFYLIIVWACLCSFSCSFLSLVIIYFQMEKKKKSSVYRTLCVVSYFLNYN